MKIAILLSFLMAVSGCSGMKVMKTSEVPKKPKSGLSFGGSPIKGGMTVQKVGYWCEAKNGILTVGAFGPTEEEAKKNAQSSCHDKFKDGACEIASCRAEK